MELTHIEDKFVDIGGKFYTSGFDIREKLTGIKALLFDWDGVFNDGFKGTDEGSTFSEIDTLGVDMLRFGFQLAHGNSLKTGIITGERNPVCINWAKREHINVVYSHAQDKAAALQHFCKKNDCTPSQVVYFFDDVLDVPIAEKAGIRLAVTRKSNPMFMEYLERHRLADYISGCRGKQHAVREFCELLLYLMEKEFVVVDERAAYSEKYQKYRDDKQLANTSFYRLDKSGIMEDRSIISFKRPN